MSIYRTVLKMPYSKESNNMCFLPLVGGAGDSDPCYQTNSIVDSDCSKKEFNVIKYFFLTHRHFTTIHWYGNIWKTNTD